MSTPPEDELEAWLRALGGAESAAARDPEAAAVRRAVLAQARHEPAPTTDDDAAWERMRFRLRRERLVVRGTPAWRTWLPAAAVAAVLAAVALPLLRPGDDYPYSADEAPGLRGAPVQELAASDPLAAARKAARIASRADRAARIYYQGASATLDFELGPSAPADVQEELKREFPQASSSAGFNRWVFRRQP